ncbi:MAG: guanylate kinase, partial [Aggregatilineales bacterium]
IRPDEVEDVSHYFVSPAEFRQMITDDALLEHQEVTPDKYYGIIRARVDERLDIGEDLIADIEVLGAKIIRDVYPQRSVLIFVNVPGETPEEKLTVLRERMEQREETVDHIAERLERARLLELPFAKTCDYVIINENNQQEKAVADLMYIIEQERSRRRMILEPQEA